MEGDVVKVSATTDTPQTGTCAYTFTLGNSRVQKTNTITNSRTCAVNVPLSAFPKNGDWYFELHFASHDGTVTGEGGGMVITVNPKPRIISFTNGEGYKTAAWCAYPTPYRRLKPEQCTYQFSLNGTVRVVKTTQITNSRVCSASIPVSEFPKSFYP